MEKQLGIWMQTLYCGLETKRHRRTPDSHNINDTADINEELFII